MNSESTRRILSNQYLQDLIDAVTHIYWKIHQKFTSISPVITGILIFSMIYIVKCNNDGNLDGIEYYKQGKYAKALKSYSEFLILNPNDIKTLYNRARCFEAMGDDVKAEEDYDRVLEIEPYHINALLGLSQVYYRKRDYDAAINLAESAVMSDKENYLAHYYAGRAYHKNGYWLDALKCYNSVIELNPDYGYAYFHRSSVMLSIGLRPMGCHDLKSAVALNVEGAREALQKYCSE